MAAEATAEPNAGAKEHTNVTGVAVEASKRSRLHFSILLSLQLPPPVPVLLLLLQIRGRSWHNSSTISTSVHWHRHWKVAVLVATCMYSSSMLAWWELYGICRVVLMNC